MSASERQRRRRNRQRAGLAVLRIEAPLFALSDALVDAGWLRAWDAENRDAVEAALARAVAAMISGGDGHA